VISLRIGAKLPPRYIFSVEPGCQRAFGRGLVSIATFRSSASFAFFIFKSPF
jgi:hypothetical protein